MFGHGAFDSPMNLSKGAEESYEYGNGPALLSEIVPMPDVDGMTDEEIQSALEDMQKEMDQLTSVISAIFQTGKGPQFYEDKGVEWCFQNKFGPYVHWKLYEVDDDGNLTIETMGGEEVVTLLDEGQVLQIFDTLPILQGGNFRAWRSSCSDMGLERESFDYGGSAGSGDNGHSGQGKQGNGGGGGSDDAEMKPLFCWKCPAGYILGGLGALGAGYIYFMIKHPGYWVAGQAIGTGGNLIGKLFRK